MLADIAIPGTVKPQARGFRASLVGKPPRNIAARVSPVRDKGLIKQAFFFYINNKTAPGGGRLCVIDYRNNVMGLEYFPPGTGQRPAENMEVKPAAKAAGFIHTLGTFPETVLCLCGRSAFAAF